MKLQTLANSKSIVELAIMAVRYIPTALSYPIINFFAGRLARLNNLPLVQSVKNNQQMIHGGRLTPLDLQKAVKKVFNYAGRCFVDLHHSLKSPVTLQQKIVKNEALKRLIQMSRDKNFGAFLVMPHMSSFDLLFMAAAARGFETKILTIAKPNDGYKLQNRIRMTSGLEIMPVSREAHAKSMDALCNGGFVLTAVDRPVPRQRRRLTFFGSPSPLPAGHIRMALKANVPILVAAIHMNKDGLYQLSLSEPIPMIHMPEPEEELRCNAENILRMIEGYIRLHPSQWQMFYPVWSNKKNSEKPNPYHSLS